MGNGSSGAADALSQFPVETDFVDTAVPTFHVLLAAMQASAKDGDTPLDVPTTTSFTEHGRTATC